MIRGGPARVHGSSLADSESLRASSSTDRGGPGHVHADSDAVTGFEFTESSSAHRPGAEESSRRGRGGVRSTGQTGRLPSRLVKFRGHWHWHILNGPGLSSFPVRGGGRHGAARRSSPLRSESAPPASRGHSSCRRTRDARDAAHAPLAQQQPQPGRAGPGSALRLITGTGTGMIMCACSGGTGRPAGTNPATVAGRGPGLRA